MSCFQLIYMTVEKLEVVFVEWLFSVDVYNCPEISSGLWSFFGELVVVSLHVCKTV